MKREERFIGSFCFVLWEEEEEEEEEDEECYRERERKRDPSC